MNCCGKTCPNYPIGCFPECRKPVHAITSDGVKDSNYWDVHTTFEDIYEKEYVKLKIKHNKSGWQFCFLR